MKVALVTGGARGIGAAIVQRLARDGAAVAFTYVSSPDKAKELADAVTASGGKALAIQADSADAAALRAAVEQTVAHFGQLDILVSSAGILHLATVDQFPLEDFDRMLAVNVRAVFVAVQAALRHMKAGGRIVTIGSISGGRVGYPGAGVYAMTKSAVSTLVRGLALDVAERGITINNVQPGPIETDMNGPDKAHVPHVRASMPVKRLGQPEEVAAMVAYLVGDEASFVTGASLTIDGGYSA
ncbi:3-oxoacyl-[acyl-carrier protein] reductase [Duganella sp. 1224]|uniref:SDR family oxidoreductase n=1 Tax=Duganella sp. 1224 TaxID=2587052 RepID=UPI0015CD5A6D|nr:SDR family oxidoreductase [Duganella sp. 1224]NYE61969.1 3-oxoacyl-[acyl-carrier protein] reductase [Duganella sp. 1224]